MTDHQLDFVCPKCLSINRVPADRLQDRPICARCKSILTTVDGPFVLTDNSFSKFVKRSDSVVVVDFWAPWCGPCRMMAPNFEKASKSLSPKFLFAKVDTEAYAATAQPYRITGIPCLIAFRGGKERARQAGAMNASQISNWLRSAI